MTKKRGYQTDFSSNNTYVFDLENRRRKAMTMLRVFEKLKPDLKKVRVLNVGGGAGAIDYTLAPFVGSIVSMDIDRESVGYGKVNFQESNLHYCVADGLFLPFNDGAFDIVICSHVYEHVPVAETLMSEINRVLDDDGVCYFSAGNRMQIMEPHYRLPFLSVIPKYLADIYMRVSGKGTEYYEKHLTLMGLKKLVSEFYIEDYTEKILLNPEEYNFEYMVSPGSAKQCIAIAMHRYCKWLFPGFIWILKKR